MLLMKKAPGGPVARERPEDRRLAVEKHATTELARKANFFDGPLAPFHGRGIGRTMSNEDRFAAGPRNAQVNLWE